MNREQCEAKILHSLEPYILHGIGDYVLSQQQILDIIHVSHLAGMTEQSERALRKFEAMYMGDEQVGGGA